MTHPNFRRAAVAIAATLACAAFAPTQAQTTATTTTTVKTTTKSTVTKKPGSGIDKSGMDTSVRPQDDLFLAVNGNWVKNTQIPADKSRWGTFDALRDRTDHQVRDLVEGLQATHPADGSNAQKVNDYFRSYVDEAAIDKAGLDPIAASLQDVDSIKDTGMLVGLMGHWQGVVRTPLGVDSNPDLDDPSVYVADIRQGGLGLPDRDYYLKTDERFAKARAAYAGLPRRSCSRCPATPTAPRTPRPSSRWRRRSRRRSGRATRRAIPSWATTRSRRPNSRRWRRASTGPCSRRSRNCSRARSSSCASPTT